MDANEIKACLKIAREAIRDKNFLEALNQCKAVLAVEKNNYNALIFIGVATDGMDQHEQALNAYKKASKLNPDQLLAWQGLSSLLEKNPLLMEMKNAISVFEKLESLNANGITKQIAYLNRIVDLHIQSNKTNKAIEALQSLLVIEKDEEKRIQILRQLLSLLASTAPHLSEKKLLLYKEALNMILQAPSLTEEDILEQTERLLLITTQTNVDSLVSVSEELMHRFPNAAPPVEFLLQSFLDRSICSGGCISSETCNKIKELTAQLQTIKVDSTIMKAAQGFLFLQEKQFTQARDLLQDIDSKCICGLYCLSQAYLALHMYQYCFEVCDKGLAACACSRRNLCVPADDMITFIKLIQANAYRSIGTAEAQDSSVKILEEIYNQENKPKEAYMIKAYIYLDQGKIEEAEKLIEHLAEDSIPVQTLRSAIFFQKREYIKSYKVLQSIVKEDPADAEGTLLLGKVLWEMRDSKEIENVKQDCFTTLLKAAKLDPHNYESFLYLGYFYNIIQQDTVKARRCFQKSYDLNPESEKAGCALVDVLVELEEEPQSLKILQTFTSKISAGSGKWAWLRLGLYQIKHDDPTTAIMSLQSALRADPEDCHVWECLADAYLQRGSLTASLKAFNIASELDPQSLYCLYQIASIKHTLGSLSEAIQEYKHVLDKSDNYVPALKGVGQSLIHLGKQNLIRCLDGQAKDNFEQAIGYLTRAVSQRPDLSCLWKLIGDAATFAYRLSPENFSIPSKLADKGSHEQLTRDVSKADLLQIGARCYSQALKILQDSGALWHDLGVNLYYQSQLATADTSDKQGFDGFTLLQRATQAIKKAIDLEPKDWRHWNILGVIACSKLDPKPALAQHCFIKSIECEASNVVAWTNLGTLYLSKGETQLACNAFSSAQSVDPNYMACWIGQALIAEIVRPEEAMDLFRHTTELGFHPESALGYGQWVLSVLSDYSKRDSEYFNYCIHQMAAIPAASDALIRYTGRFRTNAVAYNMQGLLLEHQNLFQSSVMALQSALCILEQGDPTNNINDVRMNLARVLCKQGNYEGSVTQFEMCDLSSNAEHTCMYGLALFKCDRLVDSFKVYQHALELFGDSANVSQVHTALGMVAYRIGNKEEAKSRLFDGCQTTQPSPSGLLALCALGLLQKDLTLAVAVFKELFKQEDKEKYLRDILLLQTYATIIEGHTEKAKDNLKKQVEENPSISSLWSLLAVLILTQNKDGGAAVVEYASSALADDGSGLGHQMERILISLGQLLAGHHHRQNSDKNALKTAQKAFHSNPGCHLTLSTLTCAVHAEAIIRRALIGGNDLFRVENGYLNLLLKYGKLDVELERWCLQQLVVNSIEENDITSAQTFLKQLLDKGQVSSDTEVFVKSVTMFLSNKVETLPADAQDKLQILINCALFLHNKKYDEAVTFLQNLVEQPEMYTSASVVRNVLERAAYATFSGLQDQPDNPSSKERFDNVIQHFKDKEIPSAISFLFRAVLVKEDNKRLAKHLFTTALGNIDTSRELGYCSSFIRQALEELSKNAASS